MKHAEIPLWQSPEWEQFQKAIGTRTTRVGHSLLLKYPLFFGMRYGYIPRGPWLEDGTANDFLSELKQYAEKKKLVFVKIDPEQPINLPATLKTKKTHSSQPETTLLIDLTLGEEEILKNMKRKGRYNISLAEKKGVVVKRAETSEEQTAFCKDFFRLLKATTQRDRFSGHGESYYQTMLKELPMSEIFVAFYQEKPIAAAICTYQQERAIYYYGASSNEHREVMAPYLVQWEAIKEANKRGCKTYDFLGIAPEGAPDDHPWKGITDFKSKFGGSVKKYPQPIDIIFRPWLYRLYRLLKWMQKLIKK